ncbi:biotin transporter BioY [Propionicimonas sp.]|uniref:biotin transporter BioY n=1 Tax=Propionicimonas sp. TaxID=1955623 RepID=UPI0018392B0C|nr:biotin transporter BioY [Propionicimonas sp.]MBU3977163.1 biotin transporter BioY [Actinomycetota bacterium]MBA3021090.1 biotin transporter BioY [Propionicimonas sp.]MBU3985673.1 biotin transporter BioY [Actinomycetota bacterium]MBU4008458.1 biotin transporter BioY [Actinomycetota bacterium]MBU4066392.1 biotin transporter BioY [Actinomycetota bacterium]
MDATGRTSVAGDLALVAVFGALITAFSIVPAIPIGIGVPITLQTLAVVLAGLVLGPWRGFLATLLYIAVGLAGLPVFAAGVAGPAVFGKASIGYLLAFPLGALLAGLIAKLVVNWRGAKQYLGFFIAGLAASVVIHGFGIVGLILGVAHLAPSAAFLVDLAFWPGDLAKMFVAAAIAVAVHRAFPAVLGTRRVPVTA